MVNPFVLAFGFANAAILGWLAAAAAPILIHLWMKRVRRETPWAAVRFLQAAIKRHARRLRLQEWLLLAIRTAIILLVVLAASKPLLESLGGLLGGARTHRVLVIDASLSMSQKTARESSSFEQAKELAGDLVKQSRPGDSFSLCVMADPVVTTIGEATTDAGAVRRAIARLEPTQGTASLPAAIAAVSSILDNAQQAGGASRREVVFFSDLTVGTWAPLSTGEGAATESDLDQTGFAKLAERAELSVVDVGGEGATNAAATQLAITSGAPTLRQPVQLRGSVERFGGTAGATRQQTVELLVDGVAVESQEVEWRSGEPAELGFNHRFRRPGWRRLALRLPDDELLPDDKRYLAVHVKPYVKVLCVEGARDAARYVADALNPTGDPDAPIQARVVSDAELASVDLSEFDSIFLCNVAEFSQRETERLDRYVRAGGGLVFFLGDRVRPERYNTLLGRDAPLARSSPPPLGRGARGGGAPGTRLAAWKLPESRSLGNTPIQKIALSKGAPLPQPLPPWGEGSKSAPSQPAITLAMLKQPEHSPLLPVTLGPSVAQTGSGVDPLDYAHPIVAPFRGRERAGLLTTPVERYFKMTKRPAATEATTVLATFTGDPLMVASPVAAGRVVVVATAASLASVDPATGRPWTAMPAWPSFVPIVRELVRYTSGAGLEEASLLVGDSIRGDIGNVAQPRLEVTRPDDASDTVELPQGDPHWEYARTDLAGFYAAGQAGDEAVEELFAVNVPTIESDLTRVAASALPAELGVRHALSDDRDAVRELAPPVGIHQGLLMAALGLVLLETILACRFGRGAG